MKCSVCGDTTPGEHLPCSLIGETVSSGLPMGEHQRMHQEFFRVDIKKMHRRALLARPTHDDWRKDWSKE